MSSTENQNEVATQRADDGLSEKDKSSGDLKSDSSPHKRSASEIAEDGDIKQKVQKTDHKDKENGEDKYEEGDGAEDGDEDDEAVPDGEDFDEEGEEDGAEDDGEEEDDEEA